MQVLEQAPEAYDNYHDELDMYQQRAEQTSIDKAAVLHNWIEDDIIKHETKRQAAEVAMMQDKVALKYPKYQITNLKKSCSDREFATNGTYATAFHDSATEPPVKAYGGDDYEKLSLDQESSFRLKQSASFY